MIRYFVIALFLSSCVLAQAQYVTISGWVIDEATGEYMTGVIIKSLSANQGTQTDNYGFFTLKCPVGKLSLDMSYLGYKRDTLEFQVQKDTVVHLVLSAIVLQEVVIKASGADVIQSVGVLRIPISELRSRPMLLGEPDIIKALSLTPGVKTGTEGSTGLYIRGGTPDQNFMLLDGATVYNNSHLFGFVSVFNPDAIKSVSLYKGQMPARYGGRLSSVLDISMNEGNNQKRSTSFSAGLISSRFLTEGPLKKGKSSYLFSARSSYLGLLALPARINYNSGNRTSYANYWMYDLNAKINVDLGRDSRFYLSFYSGKDEWKSLSNGDVFGLNWGNQTATARYTRLMAGKLFWTAQATWNTYQYLNEQTTKSFGSDSSNITVLNRSKIQDIQLKNIFQWAVNSRNSLEFGIETGGQSLLPQAFYYADSIPPPTRYQGRYAAFFMEDRIIAFSVLKMTAGIRLGTFNTGGKHFFFPDPRLQAACRIAKNVSVEASWRKNYQPIHLLTSNGVGLPNSIWVPATANIPPSEGTQWSVGANVFHERTGITFTLESYYKTMSNLLDFRQGFNFFNSGKNWEQLVTGEGKGRAYGFELLMRKTTGALNGWVAYTLAFNDRQFNAINSGKWFPHQYDRRHEFSVTNNYTFSERWIFSSNFIFSSGNAFTAPSYIAVVYDDQNNTLYSPVFLGKNNRRGPVYHRLDVSATRKHTNKKNRAISWTFGIYNTYAHNNPFYIDPHIIQFSPDTFSATDKILVRYTIGSVFNFIPSVSYGIQFR